jgi:hypothetical protein
MKDGRMDGWVEGKKGKNGRREEAPFRSCGFEVPPPFVSLGERKEGRKEMKDGRREMKKEVGEGRKMKEDEGRKKGRNVKEGM